MSPGELAIIHAENQEKNEEGRSAGFPRTLSLATTGVWRVRARVGGQTVAGNMARVANRQDHGERGGVEDLDACVENPDSQSTAVVPGLQEAILFLPRGESGMEPATERDLRPIVAEADWGEAKAGEIAPRDTGSIRNSHRRPPDPQNRSNQFLFLNYFGRLADHNN